MDAISNTLYFQAYNVHTWLSAYAVEFLRLSNEQKQIIQNTYLDDYKEDSLQTENVALRDNFGMILKATRPEGWSRTEYVSFLKTIRTAWMYATTHESFQLVANAFTGVDCEITEYINNRDFPIGTAGKLRVKI